MARHIFTFDDLVACNRRTGVPVVKAPSSHRGKIGEMGTVYGLTLHWTGTPNSFRPTEDYPDYNVVKEGRAGLWNSLSADGLGRFRNIYAFSEDISWHAGAWSWKGITDGNGHFLGTEAAGNGAWTEFQRKVYPRMTASKLLFLDAPVDMAPTHADGAVPRGRKSDFPSGGRYWLPDIPTSTGRTFHEAVAWLMKHPDYININYKGAAVVPPKPKGWLMALSDKQQDDLYGWVKEIRDGLFEPAPRAARVLRPGDTVTAPNRLRKIDYMDDARLGERPEPDPAPDQP